MSEPKRLLRLGTVVMSLSSCTPYVVYPLAALVYSRNAQLAQNPPPTTTYAPPQTPVYDRFEPPPGPVTDRCKGERASALAVRSQVEASYPVNGGVHLREADDRVRSTWLRCQEQYLAEEQQRAQVERERAGDEVQERLAAEQKERSLQTESQRSQAYGPLQPESEVRRPVPDPSSQSTVPVAAESAGEEEPSPRKLTKSERDRIAQKRAQRAEAKAKRDEEKATKDRGNSGECR